MIITKKNNGFDVIVDTKAAKKFFNNCSTNLQHNIFGCWIEDGQVKFSDAFQTVKNGVKREYANKSDYVTNYTAIVGLKYVIIFDYFENDGAEITDEASFRLFDPDGNMVFEINTTDLNSFDVDKMIEAWMTSQYIIEEAVKEN